MQPAQRPAEAFTELYARLWASEGIESDEWSQEHEFERVVASSLEPSSRNDLLEGFAALGVSHEDTVLDLGCGLGQYAIPIAQRFGCRVVGVDPSPMNVAGTLKAADEGGVGDRVTAIEGVGEHLPVEDGSVSFVWSSDALMHMQLRPALKEIARVLGADGVGYVLWQGATERLSARELERLAATFFVPPGSMALTEMEDAVRDAGLAASVRHVGSEWAEHELELGDPHLAKLLLLLTRLDRREAELVERFGRERFEVAHQNAYWQISVVLGKISPSVWTLRKQRASA